jgi:hypothetical protein
MDTPAKSARINLAIQVFKQTQSGMTVCDACKVVGLARSSYYFIFHNNPEAFNEFQEMLKAEEKREFVKLVLSHRAILDQLIQDALSPSTSPRERLAIAKRFDDRIDELTKKYGGTSGDDKATRKVLTGPVRELAKSRFSGEPHSLT